MGTCSVPNDELPTIAEILAMRNNPHYAWSTVARVACDKLAEIEAARQFQELLHAADNRSA